MRRRRAAPAILSACVLGCACAAPAEDGDAAPPPEACAEGELRDERDRCVPEPCLDSDRADAPGLHAAQWGDPLVANGTAERPYRTLDAALRAARELPVEDRAILVDVGEWREPVRVDSALVGLRLRGRCREGVTLVGGWFPEEEVTLASGSNPSVMVLDTEDVELADLTLTGGVRGLTVLDSTGRLENVRIHDVREHGLTIDGLATSPRRTAFELVDVSVSGVVSEGTAWVGCLSMTHADVSAQRLALEGCPGAGLRVFAESSFSGEAVSIRDVEVEREALGGFALSTSRGARVGIRDLEVVGAAAGGVVTNRDPSSPEGPCPAVCEGLEVDGACPDLCLLGAEIAEIRTGAALGTGLGLALQRTRAVLRDLHVHDTEGVGVYVLRSEGSLSDSRIERARTAGVLARRTRMAFRDLHVEDVTYGPEFGGGCGFASLVGYEGHTLELDGVSTARSAGAGVYAVDTDLAVSDLSVEDAAGAALFSGVGGAAAVTLDARLVELNRVGGDGLLLDGPVQAFVSGVFAEGLGGEEIYRQACGDLPFSYDGFGDAACRDLPRETRPHLRFAFSLNEASLED